LSLYILYMPYVVYFLRGEIALELSKPPWPPLKTH
jgi:hypothetical protein